MLNRPFSATNINVFDEKTHNSAPANFCGQNVLVSQEQHRKIFNTLTTSISGIPSNSMCYPTVHPCRPNSITFTFNSRPQSPWQCNIPQSPTPDPLAHMQRQNEIGMMQLHNYFNPPQWRFHMNCQTSTSDLGANPNARADLNNAAGMFGGCFASPRTNPRKLTLKTQTAKVKPGGLLEGLDDPDEEKRKVSFKPQQEAVKDQEVQVALGCKCCLKDPVTPKPVKEHKKRGRRKKSPSTTESNDNRHKQSPKRRDCQTKF